MILLASQPRRRSRRRPALVLFVAASLAICPASALAQNDQARRDYSTPGLLLETGARTGACDVLTFTKDGKYVLATGDDKVVRNWKFAGSALESSTLPILRWKIWQDTRGQIFALALSPDANNSLAAVAGRGLKNSQIAVIDRLTGKTKYALEEVHAKQGGTIWSLAFSPDQKQLACGCDDGSVWAWNLSADGAGKAFAVGQHKKTGDHNFVRLLRYLNEKELVSVGSDGKVMKWSLAQGKSIELFALNDKDASPVSRAALSADGKWLAVAVEGSRVHVRSFPDGNAAFTIKLPSGHFPQSVALDATGSRLAIGTRRVDQKASFHRELDGTILVYGLGNEGATLTHTLPAKYRVEAVCFHPNGQFLAAAEDDSYEVSLYDLNKKARVSTMSGPGQSLWAVAFAKDSSYLVGFKDQRDPDLTHPNQRGQGAWQVFDLKKRAWGASKKFVPAQAHNSWKGWEVLTSLPHQGKVIKRSDTWWVRDPAGKAWRLDIDSGRYGLPLCWTFLPPHEGKPLRLAVGHYLGVSLYELPPKDHLVQPAGEDESAPTLRPSRLMIGHNGEVTALAFSADQKVLVTASRDQTLAGWSLEGWTSQAELGASFVERNGQLLVDAVDLGSPAWEAGLSADDQVLTLVTGGKNFVFDALAKYTDKRKSPADAQQVLKNPVAGSELYFEWRRPNDKNIIYQFTTVRQRPVWKFFPTRDREWVLWRWRDYLYDASAKGDFHLGFQENGSAALDTPKFFRAEQLRHKLYQPKTLDKLFDAEAGFVKLPDIAPPTDVRIEPLAKPEYMAGQSLYVVSEKDTKEMLVNLAAKARSDGPNDKLVRAILWVNDHQARTWALNAATAFAQAVEVPRKLLRQGMNELLLQCYSHGGVRGESPAIRVWYDAKPTTPDLYTIIAGIGNYSDSAPRLTDLKANTDAKVLSKLFQGQEGKYFGKVNVKPPLLDELATADNILKQLQALQGQVRPDDLLIFHLGGHGARPEDFQTDGPAAALQGVKGFFFCCSNFKLEKARDTSLSFDDVYKELVRLPCHKVVLLDACRSGNFEQHALNNSPVRSLTPDGMGPIILSGCKANQSALEHGLIDPQAFGVFTAALRKTLKEGFKKADTDQNGLLDATEFCQGVRGNMASIMAMIGETQEPEAFVPKLEEKLVLAKK